MPREKRKKKPEEGSPEWLTTYSDMVTLLLTFFIMMFTAAEIDGTDLKLILAAFDGLGVLSGGNTLESGKLAELGNNIMTLPSMNRGRSLANARKRAVSEFEPEIKSKMVRVTEDERGLVISLAADSFFRPASARVDIDETRTVLQRVSALLSSEAVAGRKFRIEGHTDGSPTDPDGPWPTNWELSTARAVNVLHYLTDYGVNDRQFQAAGFADTVPIASEDTPEGRAYNRRVDIIILSDGHL